MGTPLTILLLTVFAFIVGGALVLGAPVFALPILLVVLGAAGAYVVLRRSQGAREVRDFREQAETEDTDFTARDKLTQT